MALRPKRGWICAAVALAIGLLAGRGRAEAGLITGIMIDQTTLMPTGDPEFEYHFRAVLLGRNALSAGDYIEFDNMPDYAGASFRSAFYGNSLFAVSTTGGPGGTTDVRFTYIQAGMISNPGSGSIPLGEFLVATTDNYDPNTIPPRLNMMFPYITQTTSTVDMTKNFGSGLTPLPSTSVPGPPAAALVAIGLPAVAAALRGGRRRGKLTGRPRRAGGS